MVSSHKGRIIFFVLITLTGIGVLAGLPRLSLPLGLSYILSLILSPLIPQLMKLGLSRTYAIGLLLIGLTFSFIFPFVKFIPAITEESENLQYYVPKMESFLRNNYQKVLGKIQNKTGINIGTKVLDDMIKGGQLEIKGILLKIPNFMASFFEWLLLIPFFLFFLLKDGDQFKQSYLRLVPNQIFEQTYNLIFKFNKNLGDYIFAKFVEASIIGIITTAGLLYLNVRFAFLLGGFAAVTNVVPYVGPFLGVIPAIIVALIEDYSGGTWGAIIALYSIANIVDLALIFPILVSKIVDIHPIIVVISVILGSQYMGLIGMVVSVPLAAIAKLVLVEIYKELNPVLFKNFPDY